MTRAALALLALTLPAHAADLSRQMAGEYVLWGYASGFTAAIAAVVAAWFAHRLWGLLLFVLLLVASLALALLPLPAHAAGNAPMAALVPLPWAGAMMLLGLAGLMMTWRMR